MDKISSIANEAIDFYENCDIYNCMDILGNLYNATARAGSMALIQTEDKFKVGKAFALFTVMAKVQNKDLLSVAAENSFFCLYTVCKDDADLKAVAAYYIWAILKYAPETLQDKIEETYIANYSNHVMPNFRPGFGFINPYGNNSTIDSVMQYVAFLKSYYITLFYNPSNQQLLFKEKGIVMDEVLYSIKSEYNMSLIEKQSIGNLFSQQLFDEIEDTLYKDYSSQY